MTEEVTHAEEGPTLDPMEGILLSGFEEHKPQTPPQNDQDSPPEPSANVTDPSKAHPTPTTEALPDAEDDDCVVAKSSAKTTPIPIAPAELPKPDTTPTSATVPEDEDSDCVVVSSSTRATPRQTPHSQFESAGGSSVRSRSRSMTVAFRHEDDSGRKRASQDDPFTTPVKKTKVAHSDDVTTPSRLRETPVKSETAAEYAFASPADTLVSKLRDKIDRLIKQVANLSDHKSELEEDLAQAQKDCIEAEDRAALSRDRNLALLTRYEQLKANDADFRDAFIQKWEHHRIKDLEDRHEKAMTRLRAKMEKTIQEAKVVKDNCQDKIKALREECQDKIASAKRDCQEKISTIKAECDARVKQASPATSRIIRLKDNELRTKAEKIAELQRADKVLREHMSSLIEEKRELKRNSHGHNFASNKIQEDTRALQAQLENEQDLLWEKRQAMKTMKRDHAQDLQRAEDAIAERDEMVHELGVENEKLRQMLRGIEDKKACLQNERRDSAAAPSS